MAHFVLLSGSSGVAAADLHRTIAAAGFVVQPHVLGATPPVDFALVAVAVIDVGDKPEAAIAQTRRWRAELGDEFVSIVWMLPALSEEATVKGLEAGADVVLARPVADAVFVAQLRSAARARASGLRLSARASEALLLGEQLQKAFAQVEREQAAARHIQRARLQRTLPALGAARFAVSHHPRSRVGGDFYDVRILDEHHVGFFVGDVIGSVTAGSLLGVFAAQSVSFANRESGLETPGEVLTTVSRELLRLNLDERPLVAMLAGTLNVSTGELKLARAGLPAPIHLTAAGEATALTIPGPFLGTAETTYPTIAITLSAGDKLVVATDGIRLAGDPGPGEYGYLREALVRRHDRVGQAFVDAVANELLSHVRHEDDLTLMGMELSRL